MRSSICALPPSSYSSHLETSPRPKPDFTVATRAAGKENLHFHDEDEEEAPFSLADATTGDWTAAGVAPTSPLFERGRLYDLYSARRNERLKRKHGWYAAGEEEAGAMAEDPCVAVELSKRRGAKKAAGAPESMVRRSMPAAAAAEFSQSYRAGGGLSAMRSSLRSSKEMKKPSAASSCATAAKPSAAKGRRVGSQSSVRRI